MIKISRKLFKELNDITIADYEPIFLEENVIIEDCNVVSLIQDLKCEIDSLKETIQDNNTEYEPEDQLYDDREELRRSNNNGTNIQ